MEKELKILSIGNSFSEDAQRYLYGIAESFGKKIHNVNLFIGGCSLERHYNNMKEDLAAYKIIRHGVGTTEFVSIKEALTSDEWDYVTLQQVSTQAANAKSYRPYIQELADYVRKYAPSAKILLHETWSYAQDSLSKKYGRTCDMFSRIERVTRHIAKEIGADGFIPAGETLERLKEERGLNVHCDGKHAGHGLGRYALALTWCEYLFGTDSRECKFHAFDVPVPESYAKAARECAHATIEAGGACYYPSVTTHDIQYMEVKGAKNPAQTMDIYFPECESFPTLIYFHGGGFVNGDKECQAAKALSKYFNDRGIAFVSANYRMYPNAAYPDFIRDGAAAVAWIKKHIAEYGGNEKMFVGGTSAGGYLTEMLCFDRKYLGFFDIEPETITGYIHDAGQPTTHFNVMRERGFDRRKIMVDDAAPMYHVGEAREYAPMLFTFADNDMINRREQNELLMLTMKHFGYDMSKVETYTFENSTHSSYTAELDGDGESRFGKIIYEFISKL